jgi:hypothetical protein
MSSSHWRIYLRSYCQLRCSQCCKCVDIQSFELRRSFLIFITFLLKCLQTESSEHGRCFLLFFINVFVLLLLLLCICIEMFAYRRFRSLTLFLRCLNKPDNLNVYMARGPETGLTT